MGLAGTYMPGLKALTDRLPERAAPRAVGFFTAISAIGSAFSIFAVGWLEPVFGWRIAVALMAVFPIVALLLVFGAAGPQAPPAVERRGALLDFRPVFANRRVIAYVFAYGAHTWELFALRSWIVAYLVFSQSLQVPGASMADWSATSIAAVLVMLGLPASVLGNEASSRFGRRRVVIVIMAASALMACVMGFLAALSLPLLLGLMAVYSCLVAGESASVTAGVLTNAAPGQRGATLAVHSFIGFAGASAGPVVFGLLLTLGGGMEAPLAWGLGFAGGGLVVALGGFLVWRIGPR
jgi:MFS family permease